MDKLQVATRHIEEIITQENLITLLQDNKNINHYIDFEISGKIQLGTGFMCMKVIKDLYDKHSNEYWATVIEVSKNTTLSRMHRSISILGLREQDSVDFAKLVSSDASR